MPFKKIFFACVAFLGWILSPLTWWNDTFVNLPLAYILANLVNRFAPRSFLISFLLSYWLTNILGIVMMYTGAEKLSSRPRLKNERRLILTAVIIYSIISAFLIGFKIIKPF